ncbi:ABC transporter substrate binding protein [Hyphococcus sp.]|uniref:ABC transporter substrate binding protein n=1 Tax=Hyphococcus sp. TaxID=2038636 RepID=UPI0035C6946C
MFAGFFSTDASAQQQRPIEAVILRPAPNPAFDEIFDSIEVGVRSRESRLSITERRLNTVASPDALRSAISSDAPQVVVTLGRQADESYRNSGLEIRQVVGGLDIEPGLGIRDGVSLTADPVFLLSRLQTLMPEKRRIIVVYDPSKDRWLIERAKAISASIGVTIVAHEATTLSEASNQYWNILKYGNPETDVLWLLSNPSFVSNSNLPRLVEESWRRNFAIVSNNIDHARRGALIAIYPDLEAMGAQLADQAIAISENPNKRPEVEPLGAVKFAVNKRIANHLNVSISAQDERSFDLILGER